MAIANLELEINLLHLIVCHLANVWQKIVSTQKDLDSIHMGGGGEGGDSTGLQIVFFITSIRGAPEPRNLVTFPKI